MAASGADEEACVAQVAEVIGSDAEAARQLLEATDWSVEDAIALHFVSGEVGGPEAGPAAAEAATPEPERPPPRPADDGPGGDDEDEPVVPPEPPGTLGFLGCALTGLRQAVMGVASEDFEDWFESRFGKPAPPFSKDCFGDAVKAALDEGRLMLLWLHQAESPATESLCREVLQNGAVMRTIRRTYTLWAGDVNRFEPSQISRLLDVTNFPALVVCQPVRNAYSGIPGACLEWPLGTFAQPVFKVSPDVEGEPLNADQAVAGIVAAAEDHREAAEAREVEAAARTAQLAEERLLREEQDREFQESLLMDQMSEVRRSEEAMAATAPPPQATEAASAVERPAGPAEQAAAPAEAPCAAGGESPARERGLSDEEEARRRARGAEISAAPEPEPAGPATAKLSLRLPSGDRLQRTFRADQCLDEVYEWAHCCRPVAKPVSFVLCTTFPARSLTNRSDTLGDAGLAPSSALLMKEADA